MSRFTSRRMIVVGTGLALLVGVGAIIGLTAREGQAEDPIERASQEAGFEIRVPSYLTDGELVVKDAWVTKGPPGHPSPLIVANVSLTSRDGSNDAKVRIEELNHRYVPPDEAVPVDIGVPGTDLFVSTVNRATGDSGEVYHLLTPDRGYQVSVGGSDPPPRDEVLKMLRSLVQ